MKKVKLNKELYYFNPINSMYDTLGVISSFEDNKISFDDTQEDFIMNVSDLPLYLNIAVRTFFLPNRWKIIILKRKGDGESVTFIKNRRLFSYFGYSPDKYDLVTVKDVRRSYYNTIFPTPSLWGEECILVNWSILDFIKSPLDIDIILSYYRNTNIENKKLGKFFLRL